MKEGQRKTIAPSPAGFGYVDFAAPDGSGGFAVPAALAARAKVACVWHNGRWEFDIAPQADPPAPDSPEG